MDRVSTELFHSLSIICNAVSCSRWNTLNHSLLASMTGLSQKLTKISHISLHLVEIQTVKVLALNLQINTNFWMHVYVVAIVILLHYFTYVTSSLPLQLKSSSLVTGFIKLQSSPFLSNLFTIIKTISTDSGSTPRRADLHLYTMQL